MMDTNDFFRKFFGFPERHMPSPGDDDPSQGRSSEFPGFGRDHSNDDGFHFFSGDQGRGLDGMFEHFHRDMWTQMEALHQQMEEMMKGFGAVDFPTAPPSISPPGPEAGDENKNDGNIFIWSSLPSPFFRQGEKKNPRDFMLKDSTDDVDKPKKHFVPVEPAVPALPAVPSLPSQDDKPKFRSIFSPSMWKRSHPEKLLDTDLDGKMSEDKILEMVKKLQEPEPDKIPAPSSEPGFFSFGKSVSITTVRGADGKVEQKRTTRDSSGHEESTVTKSLGDMSYTVTTVTGEDGRQERRETYQNMDEKDLPKFENQWNNPVQPPLQQSPADALLAPPQVDSSDKDLFSRLFGWQK